MRLLIELALPAIASLITLHLANRAGIHDAQRWIGPQLQARLRSISIAWQVLAVLAGCVAALVAMPGFAALTQDALILISPATAQALLALILCGMFAGLIVALARIDIACRLLPDRLTLFLAAAGLLFHFFVHIIDPVDALLGAVAGYGALWFMAQLFRRIRAADPMGRGDFAMTAGLGAWLGWQSLPLLLMTASCVALAVIAVQRWVSNLGITRPINEPAMLLKTETAFGPALAFGGLATWATLAVEVPVG